MTFQVQLYDGHARLREVDGDLVLRTSPWKPVDGLPPAKDLKRQARTASLKNVHAEKARVGLFHIFPLAAPVHKVDNGVPVEHRVDFHSCLLEVRAQRSALSQMGRDPLQGMDRLCGQCGRLRATHRWDECPDAESKAERLMRLEAERRFIAWQKACRKKRAWYEVLKVPHKGNDHRIRVIRKFRDWQKAEDYAKVCQEKAGAPPKASFQVQVRNGVVPERPKQLLGFDPQEALRVFKPNQEEVTMAKKAKAKVKGNGAAKSAAPKVKKDKAYYLRCAAGKEDCGSGDYIRGLILKGGLSAEDIAKAAVKKFKGTTKPSDVYWNRARLKEQKIAIPE